MPSLQQTKDQERAAAAWKAVNTVVKKLEEDGDDKKKSASRKYADVYGIMAKKLPMMILTNGLGQSLAFLKSKAKGQENGHQAVLTDLSKWVTKEIYPLLETGDNKLLERLIGATGYEGDSSTQTYRRATTEAIAFLTWLKRFAEAETLGKEGADDATA